MSGVLDLCQKYFKTRDIYKLFELNKDALQKDIKKAYYKLSLQVHPDRVPEEEKEIATEKFKLLSKLYQVLSDNDKRALYNEKGIIDEEDDILESKVTNWLELWRKLFKPLTIEDIVNYEKSYKNSELERRDIKKAYLSGKGNINFMMNEIPFMKVEDEPRIDKIVREMIRDGEVPEYRQFTHEPPSKRARRHQKYARESKEAEEIKKKMMEKRKEENLSLEQAIMQRHNARESGFDSFMDKLMEKYGNDDSEVLDFSKTKSKKAKKTPAGKQGQDANLKTVKEGKVKKTK